MVLSHPPTQSPEITALGIAGTSSMCVERPRLLLLLHVFLCALALGLPFGFLVYHTEQFHRLSKE